MTARKKQPPKSREPRVRRHAAATQAISGWEQGTGCFVLKNAIARQSLEELVTSGCSPARLILLLDLLRIYLDRKTAERLKNTDTRAILENRLAGYHGLAKLLLPLSATVQEAESAFGVSETEHLTLSSHMQHFAAVLVTQLPKLKQQEGLFSGEIFEKQYGGALISLVFAAALVTLKTGSPHYSDLTNLIQAMSPGTETSAEGVAKKVKRFRQRLQHDVYDLMEPGELEGSIVGWISTWHDAAGRIAGPQSSKDIATPASVKPTPDKSPNERE